MSVKKSGLHIAAIVLASINLAVIAYLSFGEIVFSFINTAFISNGLYSSFGCDPEWFQIVNALIKIGAALTLLLIVVKAEKRPVLLSVYWLVISLQTVVGAIMTIDIDDKWLLEIRLRDASMICLIGYIIIAVSLLLRTKIGFLLNLIAVAIGTLIIIAGNLYTVYSPGREFMMLQQYYAPATPFPILPAVATMLCLVGNKRVEKADM